MHRTYNEQKTTANRFQCYIYFSDSLVYFIDLEEEEVADTQSDGGLTDLAQKEQDTKVSGRKRMHSETTAATRQTFPGSPDTKCSRQASNLHNEREKERCVLTQLCQYEMIKG